MHHTVDELLDFLIRTEEDFAFSAPSCLRSRVTVRRISGKLLGSNKESCSDHDNSWNSVVIALLVTLLAKQCRSQYKLRRTSTSLFQMTETFWNATSFHLLFLAKHHLKLVQFYSRIFYLSYFHQGRRWSLLILKNWFNLVPMLRIHLSTFFLQTELSSPSLHSHFWRHVGSQIFVHDIPKHALFGACRLQFGRP